MNFFKRKKKKTGLQVGDMYAVIEGDYAGQFLIYIESGTNDIRFLSSPLLENRTIPKETFDFGLENGILEYVERVPKSVRTVTRAKYDENLQRV